MSEYKTEFLTKTRYISLKIIFPQDPTLPAIKIKQQIGSNGICNIEKISQFWDKTSFKCPKFKPKSNRIQVSVNSNDLSIRLLHPYCPVWSLSDHLTFYEEDEEQDVKKIVYSNEKKKIWMPHAGSTCGLEQKGELFVYPNKVKILYQLKEKSGQFKNSIEEIMKVKTEKEIKDERKIEKIEKNEQKEDDVISQVSLDTEMVERNKTETENSFKNSSKEVMKVKIEKEIKDEGKIEKNDQKEDDVISQISLDKEMIEKIMKVKIQKEIKNEGKNEQKDDDVISQSSESK